MWPWLVLSLSCVLQAAAISSVATLVDECASDGCRDWYGSCREHGSKWTDDDTWVYECMDTQTRFTGCRATDRAQQAIIPAGQKITVDGFWFMCQMLEDVIVYEQEPHCEVEGEKYHLNDTYRRGTFEWICLRTGLWIVAVPGDRAAPATVQLSSIFAAAIHVRRKCSPAKVQPKSCHYTDAQKGEDVRVPEGSSSEEGVVRHNCRRISDNPGRVQYWTEILDTGDDSNTATFAGRGESAIAPDPVNQRLDGPPRPWLHEYADSYVTMDGTFDVKMRFLQPTQFAQ